MSDILLVLLLLILLSGVGWGGYSYTRGASYGAPVGLLGLVLIIILIVWLVRGGVP